MKQIFRTAGPSLAVLFLFLLLQVVRVLAGEVVCNAAGPWGLALPQWLLISIGIIVVPIVYFILEISLRGWNLVWGVFFLAGGLSNLFERLSFGCIMDYIHTVAWFPVFNMADLLLTIAVLGFLWENKHRSLS